MRVLEKHLPPQAAGDVAMLFLCVVWGATFAFVRDAMDSVSAYMFLALRFGAAAILFLPLVWWRRGAFSMPLIRAGLVLSVFYVPGFVLQTGALAFSSASRVAFLTSLITVFVPMADSLIRRRRPDNQVILGLILAMLGSYLLSGPGGEGDWRGDAMAAGCAAVFAFHIWFTGKYAGAYDPVPISFVQIVITAAVCGAIAMIQGKTAVHFNVPVAVAVGYTATLATVFSMVAQLWAQARTTPVRVGFIHALEPVCASLFAWWWLNERMGGVALAGAILILASMVVTLVDWRFAIRWLTRPARES
ncbi:MAG: hypothetical protein GMKNLPBB_00537 [Myxococcota bacterium]|nr:hypothetical protein [Myxococcota bacterium]